MLLLPGHGDCDTNWVSENLGEEKLLVSSVIASRKEIVSLQPPGETPWHLRMKLAQRAAGPRDGEEVAESSWFCRSLDPTMPEAGPLTFLAERANTFLLLAEASLNWAAATGNPDRLIQLPGLAPLPIEVILLDLSF